MNKSELITAIATEAGLTKMDAQKALNAFIKVTGETLKKGDKILIPGFGSFTAITKSARTGHNPRTGATIQIPAKKTVKFKAGSELATQVEK